MSNHLPLLAVLYVDEKVISINDVGSRRHDVVRSVDTTACGQRCGCHCCQGKAAPAIPRPEVSPFEQAVEIIKSMKGCTARGIGPLVGYGHKVLRERNSAVKEHCQKKEAEALLRKDLLKNCAVFREFGADSLLLGVLAYNIGSGATMRSSVVRKLRGR